MSKPIDIDDRELVLYRRQSYTIRRLLKISAEEIAHFIPVLVTENCTGCITGHLSQTQHQCNGMEKDERLCLYFDSALERASKTKVAAAITESLRGMSIRDSEMCEYGKEDWKTVFCVKHRQTLKHLIFELI